MSKKAKKNIHKAFSLIWAIIAGTLTYFGAVAVIASLWNGDERVLFVAFVPALITAYIMSR